MFSSVAGGGAAAAAAPRGDSVSIHPNATSTMPRWTASPARNAAASTSSSSRSVARATPSKALAACAGDSRLTSCCAPNTDIAHEKLRADLVNSLMRRHTSPRADG